MYKKEEMINLLLDFCNKIGRKPTDKEICNKNGLPAVTTYILRFGSVYNTFKIVKPEYAKKKAEYIKENTYSKKDMLGKLKKLCNELNRKPTIMEVNKNKTLPCSNTYASKFGSVEKALNIIRPDLIDEKDYSSGTYLKNLKMLCVELKRKPVKWEIDKCEYTPSVTTYRNRFGNLKNVYMIIYPKYSKEIGIDTYKNKEWLKEQYYKKRKTITEIAKNVHVRPVTISKFMKCCNLKIKHKNKDTGIEILFEKCLKKNNISYERQWAYKLGIADFYLQEYNAVVECDGDYWHNLPKTVERDRRQTEYLISIGYDVFHFWEHSINKDVEKCLFEIIK